jgi:hypothetical protein
MRTHFGLPFLFICSVCTALALDREFGYPLFRTFTAYDYGEVGQIFAVTEEPYGRMLFRCQDAILVFDNNRWQTIPAPGMGLTGLSLAQVLHVRLFAGSARVRLMRDPAFLPPFGKSLYQPAYEYANSAFAECAVNYNFSLTW